MVELIKQLGQLTLDFVSNIESATAEEVEAFVEERGRIIDRLRLHELDPAVMDKYRPILGKILQYDDMITARMAQLRDEAGAKIKSFSTAQVQRTGYELHDVDNSYFFDQKK